MPQGPSVRVLLFHPTIPVPRSLIDWVVDRQAHARIVVPPSLAGLDAFPPRARHEPFTSPGPESSRLAAEAAGLLPEGSPVSRVVAEAAALALCEEGAVMTSGPEIFREMIGLSSWSMNVPERPTDGLLAQHLGIAARLPREWKESAVEAVDALLDGDEDRAARLVRKRRQRARHDGPERFRRLAPRSAGLRPAAVYLDLLKAFSAAGSPAREWLGELPREQAEALLAVAGAVFL